MLQNVAGVNLLLKPKQVECLELLAAGMSVTEAAARLKISRKTASLWKNNNDEFKKEYDRLIRGRFKELSPAAVNTLAELLGSPSETVRLGAAKEILRLAGFSEDGGGDVKSMEDKAADKLNEVFGTFKKNGDGKKDGK